ncbi:MAG TPA: O-antigen ligase family protein [Terriglobia bacterium]|nr:O-antigen ligase family protein [Terriglobia bacterium]
MMTNSKTSWQAPSFAVLFIGAVICVGLAIGIAVNPLVAFLFLVVGIFAAVFIKKYGFLHFVVTLVFLELILGGSGRVYEFNDFFSIRKVLFLLVWILFLVLSASNPQRFATWFRSASWARGASLLGVATFIFFGLGVGIFRGNRLDYITADASGLTFITLSIPLGYFASLEKMKVKFLLGVVLGASSFFGLVKGIVFSGARLGYFDFGYVINLIQNEANQAVSARNSLGMDRMSTVGDIFLMFSLILCIATVFAAKRWRTREIVFAGIAALIWGLFASGSRGLWLGSVIGIAVIFALVKFGHRLKILALIAIGTIALLQLFPQTLQDTSEWVQLAFNLREYNNLDRVEQAPILISAGMEHPLIGNGFGHTLPNLVRSYEAPYAFELLYLALFMKMGILGCALWLVFLSGLLLNLLKMSKSLPNPANAMVAVGLCAGIISVLAVSAADPYLAGPPGMGILALSAVVLDHFREQVEVARFKGAESPSPMAPARYVRVPRMKLRQVPRSAKY